MDGPRILVVGYSGANNTGAEALVRADIEDLGMVLGKDLRSATATSFLRTSIT